MGPTKSIISGDGSFWGGSFWPHSVEITGPSLARLRDIQAAKAGKRKKRAASMRASVKRRIRDSENLWDVKPD